MQLTFTTAYLLPVLPPEPLIAVVTGTAQLVVVIPFVQLVAGEVAKASVSGTVPKVCPSKPPSITG